MERGFLNSKDEFFDMAYKSGFKIISGKFIGWGEEEDLNYITLVEKNDL